MHVSLLSFTLSACLVSAEVLTLYNSSTHSPSFDDVAAAAPQASASSTTTLNNQAWAAMLAGYAYSNSSLLENKIQDLGNGSAIVNFYAGSGPWQTTVDLAQAALWQTWPLRRDPEITWPSVVGEAAYELYSTPANGLNNPLASNEPLQYSITNAIISFQFIFQVYTPDTNWQGLSSDLSNLCEVFNDRTTIRIAATSSEQIAGSPPANAPYSLLQCKPASKENYLVTLRDPSGALTYGGPSTNIMASSVDNCHGCFDMYLNDVMNAMSFVYVATTT